MYTLCIYYIIYNVHYVYNIHYVYLIHNVYIVYTLYTVPGEANAEPSVCYQRDTVLSVRCAQCIKAVLLQN